MYWRCCPGLVVLMFCIRLLRLFVSSDGCLEVVRIINSFSYRLLTIFARRISYRRWFCRSITHLGILDFTILHL